jgi:CubicO group peptidase (beta-lactamase class C family)
MNFRLRYCLVNLLIVILFSCDHKPERSTEYTYKVPTLLNDGFKVGGLKSEGIDSLQIIKLTELIMADSFPNIHSLLILKNEHLVYENYFGGKDEIRGKKLGYIEHSADKLHDCRSITKSITSACVGLALQHGFIQSVDEPVAGYFPEYSDLFKGTKRKMTIRDLLTMTSGLEWNEEMSYRNPRNSELRMDWSSNPYEFVLSRELIHEPGTKWNYNGGNTELLAEIIRRTSSMPVDKFTEKYLFEPMGIESYAWVELFKNSPAAASGLRMRSRDLLKLGSLYLNKGKWAGHQVLNPAWVKESLFPFKNRSSEKYSDAGYGYQFWTFSADYRGKKIAVQEAKGNGGQAIFICNSLDLVVVVTAGNYNQWDIKNDTYSLFINRVLPAIGI